MANEIEDVEQMSADEHEALMDAMLNGDFVGKEDVQDDDLEDENTDEEDTDQEEDSEDDADLDEDSDGDLDEDVDDEDDDEEEHTLVDEDGSEEDEDEDLDEEGEDETEEDADEADTEDEDGADDADETEDTESDEDDTDTDAEPAGETAKTTDVIDYKKFYDEVTQGEITVNGRKVKKFTDPKKIIQSIQMAGGFSDKMAGFKKYRPFTAALKDRGMLEDPEKFNLAMNLVDGDKEALKAHMKTLGIDPVEIEMDEINYEGKSFVSSQEEIALEDTMDIARSSGVEDQLRKVIGTDWDQESFDEFVKNPSVRSDLITHLSTPGLYDSVQSKIQEMKLTDVMGSFTSQNSVTQYRQAVGELQREGLERQQAITTSQVADEAARKSSESKAKVKAAKAKIAEDRRKADYEAEALVEKERVAKKRAKAASVSKKKPKAKAKKAFDPMDVEGEDLDALMDALIGAR